MNDRRTPYRFVWRCLLLVVALGFLCPVSADPRGADPKRKVHEVTLAVTARLAESTKQLQADPEYIKSIVADLILPHVDFPSLAAASVGSYWKELSGGEQNCLTDGVRMKLVERYARVLLEYEFTNIVTESIAAANPIGPVYVRQYIMTDHPEPMPVQYKMELVNETWKLVDLIVADVSLAETYRTEFADMINEQGIGDFLRTFAVCRER